MSLTGNIEIKTEKYVLNISASTIFAVLKK
jgi:hypothetical protein